MQVFWRGVIKMDIIKIAEKVKTGIGMIIFLFPLVIGVVFIAKGGIYGPEG